MVLHFLINLLVFCYDADGDGAKQRRRAFKDNPGAVDFLISVTADLNVFTDILFMVQAYDDQEVPNELRLSLLVFTIVATWTWFNLALHGVACALGCYPCYIFPWVCFADCLDRFFDGRLCCCGLVLSVDEMQDCWVGHFGDKWWLLAVDALVGDIPIIALTLLVEGGLGGVEALAALNVASAVLDVALKAAEAYDSRAEYKREKKAARAGVGGSAQRIGNGESTADGQEDAYSSVLPVGGDALPSKDAYSSVLPVGGDALPSKAASPAQQKMTTPGGEPPADGLEP